MPCWRVAPRGVTLLYARWVMTVLVIVMLWVLAFVIGFRVENYSYDKQVSSPYFGGPLPHHTANKRTQTSFAVMPKTYVPSIDTTIVKNVLKKPLAKCPTIKEFIGLANDRQMNLTHEVPTKLLDQQMFEKQVDQIQQVVRIGNFQMKQDQIRIASMRQDPRSLANGTASSITERLSPLETQCGDYLYLPGGHWKPASCMAKWKVAIIVPYRNRTFQLSIFLRYMVPFLQKQFLEFGIYIINQENNLPFNRGMLLNVGFLEAMNFSHWDCFVFHDVDHLPQSEFNPYGCVDMPRHFIGGADNRKYKVPYSTSFGGVTGFTTAQFKSINGFGNVYWGWCCEDDDLERRVRSLKLTKKRYKGPLAYYRAVTVHHDKVKTGLGALEKANRLMLRKLHKRFKTDGLNNMRYKPPHIELHTLYTNISVDIQRLLVPS